MPVAPGNALVVHQQSRINGKAPPPPNPTMREEEEISMFFKECKLPVRLAAAAYSSPEDFNDITPILDTSVKRKKIIRTERLNSKSPVPLPNSLVNSKSPVPLPNSLVDLVLNTQVYMKIIEVERVDGTLAWDLALVFRGTQPYSVTNCVTDFTFDQEPVAQYIIKESREQNIPQHDMLVHSGFHAAFKNVIPQERPAADGVSAVDRIKEFVTKNDQLQGKLGNPLPETPRRILCTGHSLGHALATLGAAWCKTTLCYSDAVFHGCHVQCITIGSPRC